MNIPNDALRAVVDEYCGLYMPKKPLRGHNVEVDHSLARQICLAYEALPVLAHDQKTRVCYQALEFETWRQFNFLETRGYRFEPWKAEGQPYANSAEVCDDLRLNKHLYFFTGGEPHPVWNSYVLLVGDEPCTTNDIFRAVHDTFGHGAEGYTFNQRGEENAWVHHSMMYSPYAQMALTTETRGQNSWVNESDVNAGKPACERAYAVQKAALLPASFYTLPASILAQWS